MAPNPRIANAFRAMRELGIPEEKTKPVLRSLLKIYDKRWELIEAENYRALADAIFESEEAEAAEQKKRKDNAEAEAAEKKKLLEQSKRMKAIEEETELPEEPERPLKRRRLRHQDGSSCTSSGPAPLKKPKLEIDDLPIAIPKSQSRAQTATGEVVSPQPQGRNKDKQPVLAGTQVDATSVSGSDLRLRLTNSRDKGKEPISSQTGPRQLRSNSGVRIKEPRSTPSALPLIKPKDEPVIDDVPPSSGPQSVIRPGKAASLAMAPNARIANAFRAMRELGIPEEKTKPVLRSLLKIYDKKWELIEAENYRALADAIFESEEAEAAEQKKKNDNAEAEAAEQRKLLEQAERMKAIEEETQLPEEPERPLKRKRLGHQDGSSCTSSGPAPLKKPKLEIDDPPIAIPSSGTQSVIKPGSLMNGDSGNNPSKESNKDSNNNLLAVYETTIPDDSTTKFDIASSSSGEIKISLTCNCANNPNLSVIDVDAFYKKMEDRCLKSYKILDPNFSVKELMKDVCNSLVDIESEPVQEPEPTSPTKSLVNTGNNGPLSTVNGSVGNEVDTYENGVHETGLLNVAGLPKNMLTDDIAK